MHVLGPAASQHITSSTIPTSNLRGSNPVSSLVRLALSSNFPSGLLGTAQSYPSLTSSNQIPGATNCSGAGSGAGLGQALNMSFTSTSSDSELASIERPIMTQLYEQMVLTSFLKYRSIDSSKFIALCR